MTDPMFSLAQSLYHKKKDTFSECAYPVMPDWFSSFMDEMNLQPCSVQCDICPEQSFIDIRFSFPDYHGKNLHVQYTSRLCISKVAPVHYTRHYCKIANPDPDRLDPFLYGEAELQFTRTQYDLDETIVAFMDTRKMERLWQADLEMAVSLEENAAGTQPTVYSVFFEDGQGSLAN